MPLKYFYLYKIHVGWREKKLLSLMRIINDCGKSFLELFRKMGEFILVYIVVLKLSVSFLEDGSNYCGFQFGANNASL